MSGRISGENVQITIQDYKSQRVAVMNCATLVDTQLLTQIDRLNYMYYLSVLS